VAGDLRRACWPAGALAIALAASLLGADGSVQPAHAAPAGNGELVPGELRVVESRQLPPRADRSGDPRAGSDELTARGVALRAAAPSTSPYVVRIYHCGFGGSYTTSTRSVTLYAYGADGGESAHRAPGGAGAVAVAALQTGPRLVIQPQIGCAGATASPSSTTAGPGGIGSGGTRGGAGGSSTNPGEAGGSGGGAVGWYLNGNIGLPLVVAGGGGGAGGGAGGDGGDGGDGDHQGGTVAVDLAQGGRAGTVLGDGAGGAPGGAPGSAGSGGTGGAAATQSVGGGGGGSGYRGGGGGGHGQAGVAPGAGGGGGASGLSTNSGYVAGFNGNGNGVGAHGLAAVVTIRPVVQGPYWPGWNIVRGVAAHQPANGGYVVDAWGGIHPFSQGVAPPAPRFGPYWRGWDIVRGIATLPDGRGGYVLDGWGGLHPFALGGNPLPPAPRSGPYWPGLDIARGVTILPGGTGGYVLDGWGGLHPFAIGASPLPPPPRGGPYWPGLDIARGVSSPFEGPGRVGGGWVSDGFGGLHPWGEQLGAPTPAAAGNPYWSGQDIARGIASFRGGDGGVEVDAYGGLHPWSSAGLP
jgi:hypothetical protein